MGRENAGSYVPNMERIFGVTNKGETREKKLSQSNPYPQIRPVASVIRPFNFEDIAVEDQWHRYIDAYASTNRSLGTVRNLGAMGVTYVTSEQMHGMHAERYPKTFAGSRPDHKMMRKVFYEISDQYNHEMKRLEKLSFHIQKQSEIGLAADDDSNIRRYWCASLFSLRPGGLLIPDTRPTEQAFYFAPDSDLQLREEFEETKKFLSDKGLKTHRLNFEDRHMTFFISQFPIDLVVPQVPIVKNVEIPQPMQASLLEPTMRVDANRRQY